MKLETEKKLILQCDCNGMHFMHWLYFTDDDEEGWPLYVCFGGTQISGLWRRLQMAWNIIRWGEWQNDGALITDELPKLKEFIDNYLEKNK